MKKLIHNKEWGGRRTKPLFEKIAPEMEKHAEVKERYAQEIKNPGVVPRALKAKIRVEAGTISGDYNFYNEEKEPTTPGCILLTIDDKVRNTGVPSLPGRDFYRKFDQDFAGKNCTVKE